MNTDQEKVCFFMNVYNLMMLHAVIRLGSNPQTGFGKELFYRRVKYNLGGYEFSLDDIEYGIFKGNQHPSLASDLAARILVPNLSFPKQFLIC